MKRFISVLGTGGTKGYSESIYQLGDFVSTKTKFIQCALLEMFENNGIRIDAVTVFRTIGATKANWDILKNEISERFKKCYIENFDCIDAGPTVIPLGSNQDELWEIFNKMAACIQDGDELYIDITHSLRNIPVQLIAAIQYARIINNVTVKGIYYGAYEMGKDEEIDGNKIHVSPIIDISLFFDAINWASATDDFIRYGNSDQMYSLIGTNNKNYKREHHMCYPLDKNINGAASKLNDFTKNVNAARGKEIAVSFKNFKNAFSTVENAQYNVNSFETLLKNLLEIANKEINGYGFDENDTGKNGIAVVRWSIKHGNILLGYTALEETIRTILCEEVGIDSVSEVNRKDVKTLCVAICTSHGKIDTIENWSEYQVTNINDAKAVTKKLLEKFGMKFFDAFNLVSQNRNSINHFEYANDLIAEELLKDQLIKCFDTINEALIQSKNG